MLPATGFIDRFAAPYTGGAVEIEKSAAAGTRAMFDDEMAVKEDGLDVREQGVVAVEIRPARLHHADFFAALRIHEVRNRAAEEIGLREKVRVEDGDEFARRGFQPIFQRAGFVAFAVGAMDVDDGHALRAVALHASARDLLRFIRGIVQHLHVQ